MLGRVTDYNKNLPILELYTCIQSEGSRAGYPTVAVRTTGCTHRCYFGEGGWCDSFYTSIHPERGRYCFQDVVDIYDKNPHIKEMMLTGGSPTMHPRIVNEITNFAHERGILVTIETEGSHYLETDYPINLLSISPKFSNSVPTLDAIKPQGGEVNQKFIDQHNKFRLNNDAIAKSIAYHSDYHIKPVIDKELKIWPEIKDWLNQMKIPKNKVWLMPAGDDIQALLESYGPVMDLANREGYNFTSRAHIMAFGTKREV